MKRLSMMLYLRVNNNVCQRVAANIADSVVDF